jgi:hypothetical protein
MQGTGGAQMHKMNMSLLSQHRCSPSSSAPTVYVVMEGPDSSIAFVHHQLLVNESIIPPLDTVSIGNFP